MADIADKLDGIVDNLFGVIDTLELGCFIEVNEVFVEIETGGGQEGSGVVMKICSDTLAFFFLEANRGI